MASYQSNFSSFDASCSYRTMTRYSLELAGISTSSTIYEIAEFLRMFHVTTMCAMLRVFGMSDILVSTFSILLLGCPESIFLSQTRILQQRIFVQT